MKNFNLRVYGLLINSKNEILVSDERRSGISFTKFPGGGLEFGEGLSEALIREFSEEMGIEITVEDLFYVNDFFQISAFNEDHQLLSFYYIINYSHTDKIGKLEYTYPLYEDGEKQRWVAISELHEDNFTFPIDKKVIQKLIIDFKK
jgi:8-oxo-dGTP diphosphatase